MDNMGEVVGTRPGHPEPPGVMVGGWIYSKYGQQHQREVTIRITFQNHALDLWGRVKQKRSQTRALTIVWTRGEGAGTDCGQIWGSAWAAVLGGPAAGGRVGGGK